MQLFFQSMKSKKDFKKWHNKKEQIDDIAKRPFFHEREVWFCHLGANIRNRLQSFKRQTQGTFALSLSFLTSALRQSRAEAICACIIANP